MNVFQRIVHRQIPADIVYEDEEVIAFRDVHPQAPVHVLVVPKRAIPRLQAASAGDVALLGQLLVVASSVARQQGLEPSGYRVVINNGEQAGQTVEHLHLHVLGGRRMEWPPG
jgi:histidine triad (HIT) family protein